MSLRLLSNGNVHTLFEKVDYTCINVMNVQALFMCSSYNRAATY